MKQQWFITFEGIDGAGKSTHIPRLAQEFSARGCEVVQTREPGGTAVAEALRTLLLHENMDALTEVLLAFAARRDHLEKVIKPALASGAVVLCDRFTDSTFAYQGAGRGFDFSTLSILEKWVQQQENGALIEPTLTLWFDIPAKVAAQRLVSARIADRFEQQSTVFFEQVIGGYEMRQKQRPERVIRINAHQEKELVWCDVMAQIEQKIWKI